MTETAESEEASDKRAWADLLTVALGLLVMNLLPELELLPKAEAFLVGFAAAFTLNYWIPPRPAEAYWRWMLGRVPVLLGAYLALFKIPALLKPRLPVVLAYALPVLAFFAAGYLFDRLRAKKPSKRGPRRG